MKDSEERFEFATPDAGVLCCYRAGPDGDSTAGPLLLIHSINAAGSAYEVRPLFEHYRQSRSVYALELPGFGGSERSSRRYTPQLMAEAIQHAVDRIRHAHGNVPVDVIALSLSCEFLARAAAASPAGYRTVGFVSPTGFERKSLREGVANSTLGKPALFAALNWRGWRRGIFSLLTRRSVIRFFLRRTWGSKSIDEDLLDHDYAITRAAGAEHAPLHFIAGCLFSADSGSVYRSLKLPVWVVRGVRGDFHGYPGLTHLANSPNWTIEVMNTGALPHFEELQQFVVRYESWLAALRVVRAPQTRGSVVVGYFS
jgi:pimeloyl-ACP methyl ester carboxylesterase